VEPVGKPPDAVDLEQVVVVKGMLRKPDGRAREQLRALRALR
jgi:hypothetical protein